MLISKLSQVLVGNVVRYHRVLEQLEVGHFAVEQRQIVQIDQFDVLFVWLKRKHRILVRIGEIIMTCIMIELGTVKRFLSCVDGRLSLWTVVGLSPKLWWRPEAGELVELVTIRLAVAEQITA